MTLSILPAQLEFACGHFALVSLASVKGESPRQRTERVQREKAAAHQRTCDFCAPRAQALTDVERIDDATTARDSAPSYVRPAVDIEPTRALNTSMSNLDATSDQEDLMTSTPANSSSVDEMEPTGSSTTAESTEPAEMGPKRVFPTRKLTDDQEREVTRLYAETTTPLAEIAQRFEIGPTSVSRVAQRHGAVLRTPPPTRSGANGTPVPSETAPGSSQTVEAEVRAAEPLATAPTTAGRATGKRRRFQVIFVAEQVIRARTIFDALQQAEARGATEIRSITRVD